MNDDIFSVLFYLMTRLLRRPSIWSTFLKLLILALNRRPLPPPLPSNREHSLQQFKNIKKTQPGPHVNRRNRFWEIFRLLKDFREKGLSA